MLAASQCWSQESVLLGKGAAGESLSVSVLETKGTTRKVQVRLTYAAAQTIATMSNVVASESTEQIDCQKGTYSVIHYALFNSLAQGATPSWTKDINSTEVQPIAVDLNAGTASTMVFRAVCISTSSTSTPTASTHPPTVNVPQNSVAGTQLPSPVSAPASISLPVPAPAPVTAAPPAAAPTSMPTPIPLAPVLPEASVRAEPALPVGTLQQLSATGNIAAYVPFPKSAISLGMMGALAEYVYIDPEQLAFRNAVFEKMLRARARMVPDGKQHPLLDEASRRLEKSAAEYSDAMHAKEAFLARNQLRVVGLPKRSQAAVEAFRAELYQYGLSQEYILVFRGTQEAMDWVSNLWTGVDLLSIEAPHYRAAYDLVAELRRRKIEPLVVGHSLGGGMAQYVGYKFGLKVVGFNSAPLPQRYYTEGAGADVHFIRLFSAIDTVPRPGMLTPEGYPDPVSMLVPQGASMINSLFPTYELMKAHQHLVQPTCVRSTPNPSYTAGEQEMYAAFLNGLLSKGVISAAVGGFLPKVAPIAADQVVIEGIRGMIQKDLSGPAWGPDTASNPGSRRVSSAVKSEVVTVAIEQYKAVGGAASVAKGGYKVAFGNSFMDMASGLGTFAAIAGKAAAANFAITRGLLPHSMARFNRGMRSVAGNDVFMEDPVRAQCAVLDSKY